MGTESVEDILGSVAQFGSLEVINHGISRDLIELVMDLGDVLFGIPPEKKRGVARSPERPFGFEEIDGEDETREGEEFLWCGEETLSLEMEGIWPNGYSNFRKHVEILSSQIEEVAAKILLFLQRKTLKNIFNKNEQETIPKKSCYIHKRCRNTGGSADETEQSLSYDVIKMLIKGSESPHALCLHVCNGPTVFHVYSKKGWVFFCPNQDSLVITIGDKLQAWSGGQYKHVIGRPVFRRRDQEKCVSMSFLYSPTPNLFQDDKFVVISLGQLTIFAILFTLACQFFVFVYNIFFK